MTVSKSLLSLLLALTVQAVMAQVPIWGQCGGIGYNGSTQCASGLTCVKQNDWYSQCLQGPAQPTTQVPTFPTNPSPTNPGPTTTPPIPTGGSGTPLSSIPAGSLTRLSNFGSNPTNVGIFVYKPSSLKENPALLVASHPCGGTAQGYFSSNQFRQLADQRGFLVLYGQAPGNSNCWDVTSSGTLRHDGGGDSLGIASAIRFAIANWGVDAERVFAVGTSSGAMMTNVLSGSYPDLIKAGAVFAGVAFNCLTNSAPSYPPDRCANGENIQTPQQWGDRVRAAYPGYTGSYPRLQIWHGTADNVLNYNNFAEQLKQWTNVHGISQTPTSTAQSNPRSGWTKTTYGSGQVIGYSGAGAGHGLPESGTESVAIDWFGL